MFGQMRKVNDIPKPIPASFWTLRVVSLDDISLPLDKLPDCVILGPSNPVHLLIPDSMLIVDQNAPSEQLLHNLLHLILHLEVVQGVTQVTIKVNKYFLHLRYVLNGSITVYKILVKQPKDNARCTH